MYVVIMGGGTIGISIAEWLLAAGNEIAIIDNDLEQCKYIDNNIGMVSILGDGTNWDSLINAGITRCDTVIATTKHDHINLISCQLAIDYSKDLDKSITTISLVNKSEKLEFFNQEIEYAAVKELTSPESFATSVRGPLSAESETFLAPRRRRRQRTTNWDAHPGRRRAPCQSARLEITVSATKLRGSLH